MESINTEVETNSTSNTAVSLEAVSELISAAVSQALAEPKKPGEGIDVDDPVMAACDEAEVKMLEDIKDNGVHIVVTRDRRGNVRKTNMTGHAYDMIQSIKDNRRSGNNNVY